MGKKKDKSPIGKIESLGPKVLEHFIVLSEILAECLDEKNEQYAVVVVRTRDSLRICPVNADDTMTAHIVGQAQHILSMHHIGEVPPKEKMN